MSRSTEIESGLPSGKEGGNLYPVCGVVKAILSVYISYFPVCSCVHSSNNSGHKYIFGIEGKKITLNDYLFNEHLTTC